jgi:hypothetical protein
MIWNLTSNEVVKYWDLIKYGTFQVNKPQDPEKYFIGLLKEILTSRAQVWLMSDTDHKIKAMAITKITQNISGIKELLIDVLYGFYPMTMEEQRLGYDVFVEFCKNLDITSARAYISDSRIGQLAQKAGLVKVSEVYKMNIKGAS